MSGHERSATAAGASRAPEGASTFTALSPAYELRQLKIAYGIQFHVGEGVPEPWAPIQYLKDNLEISDDLEKVSDTEYINHLQGVRFTIEETTGKQQFITWLKTPEVHVIYQGHARYGRGPCFGARGVVDPRARPPVLVQTEDWEEGTNSDSGLFRMGYPFIGIEASEVVEHGYTPNLVKESEGRPGSTLGTRADCESPMRGYLGSMRALPPEHIHPELPGRLRDHQDGDRYWSYRVGAVPYVIHHAGWRNTLSTNSDLGTLHDADDPDNTQMTCRVFTHLGCSTKQHNYPVVRHIAKWRRLHNERYAYWTTNVANASAIGPWVHALISYDRPNAFGPWGPSLQFAVDETNGKLRRLPRRFGNFRLI
jgi:hypothetical protein